MTDRQTSKTVQNRAVVLGGEPRVDLLPPEVRLARKGASTRRGLIVLLVLCLVAVVGGYAFTSIQAAAAASRLESAQAETARILAEQAKYSAVSQANTAIAAAQAAARVGDSTEVDWSAFVAATGNILPGGGLIKSYAIDSATPIKGFSQSLAPLAQPRIATVVLVASTNNLTDAQTWISELPLLKGVSDVTVTSLQAESDTRVDINVTIGVTSVVLANPLDGAKANK